MSNDETIVIKSADNRGVVVIVSTGHCQSMIMQNQLDKNINIKLDSYFSDKIQSNLLRFHKRQHKMCFTEPEWKFLHDKHDILLKHFLKHIKSFIHDSLHFLSKCPRDVDEDTEIVTFDVFSLYTTILHEFGLEIIN